MVDKNDSLLREVDDELRQDQLKKLWNDYGTYLLGAAALFVVGVYAYQQIEQNRIAAAEAAGSRFEAARTLLRDKKTTEAEAAFADLAKTGTSGYAILARLETAAALVKDDKAAEAVGAYDSIADDTSTDPVMRDFARLQAAALKLGTADWTEIQNRLTPLTDERSAFRVQAREYMGLAAQKAAKTDEARRYFLQVLSDSTASQGQKERVTSYLSAIVAADLGKAKPAGENEPKSEPARPEPPK